MQILIAVVVMGLIGAVAVVLTATAALVRVAPLLITVVVVVGAVRWWERRPPRPGPRAPAPPRPPAVSAPVAQPASSWRPGGWVLVPVWVDSRGRAHRHPVIDAEVISTEGHHG